MAAKTAGDTCSDMHGYNWIWDRGTTPAFLAASVTISVPTYAYVYTDDACSAALFTTLAGSFSSLAAGSFSLKGRDFNLQHRNKIGVVPLVLYPNNRMGL